MGSMISSRVLSNLSKTKTNEAVNRIAIASINDEDDLNNTFKSLYSRMKYGDPMAVEILGNTLAQEILNHPIALNMVTLQKPIVITSSAFGMVPTAACAISKVVANVLKKHGAIIEEIKIDRHGDFSTTNYGSMSVLERKTRMTNRRISLSNQVRPQIKNKLVIVIDDVYATGSHEKTLVDLLRSSEMLDCIFCYLVKFSQRLSQSDPQTEERLNHFTIKSVLDLLQFFNQDTLDKYPVTINARTVKFILETKLDPEVIGTLRDFLSQIPDQLIRQIYEAAGSTDGYYKHHRFVNGFNILLAEMVARKIIPISEMIKVKDYDVCFAATLDNKGQLIAIDSDEDISEVSRQYSLMKFGSVTAIEFFGRLMAKKMIDRFKDPNDTLRQRLEHIKNNGEYIVFISPGSRNVESAQNFIFEVAINQMNIWLALNDLPTIIDHKLTRLGSSAGNYAQLSMLERMKRLDGNRSLLPESSFFDHGIHILFGDDARITGTTADRTEKICLEQGALSFHSMYAVIIDPGVTTNHPNVEHTINTFLIDDDIDFNVLDIVNHSRFRPVQRMMRLLLNEKNRSVLKNILQYQINNQSLIKIYTAALSNDYYSDDRYRDSVIILRDVLLSKELIDENGLVI